MLRQQKTPLRRPSESPGGKRILLLIESQVNFSRCVRTHTDSRVARAGLPQVQVLSDLQLRAFSAWMTSRSSAARSKSSFSAASFISLSNSSSLLAAT